MNLERHGIPLPRTVYHVDTNDDRLTEAVDDVGGFPVVLKASEGQYGMGVVMIDSFDSLRSVVDLMARKGERSIIMQEFVDHATILRTVTIGDTVVAGRRIKVLQRDFRSHNVAAVLDDAIVAEGVTEFPADVVEMSVEATHVVGVDFSGIDILEAKDGRTLVSEVNFPCVHLTTERTAQVPVMALMVDFLVEKSRRMSSTA